MDFTDDAIVLSARRHGEANAVLSVLTREHGRHMGLVKGGRVVPAHPEDLSGDKTVRVKQKSS